MKTLIVDDDLHLLDIMYRRFAHHGLEPDRVDDGRAALTLIDRNDYDLIVTDIYMPGATGLALLKRAKDRDPHVQVVVVTAEASIDTAIEALNEGAFSYLTKPFDHISVFDNVVKRALEFRRLILDNIKMAEAQRRRGDMLEDEVTQRFRKQQQRQREMTDLLGALPDGVVVIEEGGRIIRINQVAEMWLAQDLSADNHSLKHFIDSGQFDKTEESEEITIGNQVLSVLAVSLPQVGEKRRKVVIIREKGSGTPDQNPNMRKPQEIDTLIVTSSSELTAQNTEITLQIDNRREEEREMRGLPEVAPVEGQPVNGDGHGSLQIEKALEGLIARIEKDIKQDVHSKVGA